MKPILSAFAILLFTAPGLAAQTLVYRPAPGSEIRITTSDTPGHRPIGRLDWLGADSVIIRGSMQINPEARRQAFALAKVRTIEVNRRGRETALVYGAGTGALAGMLLEPGGDQKGRNAVLIGAVLGALVGQALIPDRWETVFRR